MALFNLNRPFGSFAPQPYPPQSTQPGMPAGGGMSSAIGTPNMGMATSAGTPAASDPLAALKSSMAPFAAPAQSQPQGATDPFHGALSHIMDTWLARFRPQAPTPAPTPQPMQPSADIQALTSMISDGRAKQNFGGFLGGLFDNKG